MVLQQERQYTQPALESEFLTQHQACQDEALQLFHQDVLEEHKLYFHSFPYSSKAQSVQEPGLKMSWT